jgi:hypothetical protein
MQPVERIKTEFVPRELERVEEADLGVLGREFRNAERAYSRLQNRLPIVLELLGHLPRS